VSPAPASSAVPAALAGAPESEISCCAPESMWTSGARLSCSGGGSSFAGEVVLLGAGEDAGAGEVLWLVSGASGRVGDAGFVTFGLALELEACFGARGALKEKTSS
jgi:hypothetical protein